MEESKAFRRVVLELDGKIVATSDDGELEVALEGGGVAAIEVPADGLVLVGRPERRVEQGAWSTLRELAEARPIKRNIVRPFDEVKLSVWSVAEGDPVEVHGVVIEHAFVEANGDNFRGGALRLPSRVVAQKLAWGEPAEDLMRAMTQAIAEEPHAPPERKPEPEPAPRARGDSGALDPWGPRRAAAWVPLAATLSGALLCIATRLASGSREERWREDVIALAWLALAVSLRPWPEVPRFYSRHREQYPGSGWLFGAKLVLGALPPGLLLWAWSAESRGMPPIAWMLMVGGFLVAWSTVEWVSDAQSYLLLGRLVRARRMPSLAEDDVLGACEGRVAGPRFVNVCGHEALLGVETSYAIGLGDEPDTEKGRKFRAARSPCVRTDGGEVKLHLDECVWATTRRNEPSRFGLSYTVAEWIPRDGRVALYGRFVALHGEAAPAAHLLSNEKVPAVVFASDARGNPLDRARRILRHRSVTLIGLLLVGVAWVALGLSRPG